MTSNIDNASDRAARAEHRAVVAEIRAAAAGRFADADDAVAHLAHSSETFTDPNTGDLDRGSLGQALDELLRTKPHLRSQGAGAARPPAPNRAQGSSANASATKPGDLGNAEARRRFGDPPTPAA